MGGTINFVFNDEAVPVRVRFARLGIECELTEPCPDEVVLETRAMVQTVVTQLGEEQVLRLTGLRQQSGEEKLGPSKEHSKGRKAGKRVHDLKGVSPGPDPTRGMEGEPAPKVRKKGAQLPERGSGDRMLAWKALLRKRWQSYKRRSIELAQAGVLLATTASLQPYLAREEKLDPIDGWSISEEGLARIARHGWPKPELLVGRYAGRAVMDFLKSGKEGYSSLGQSLQLDMLWRRLTERTMFRCWCRPYTCIAPMARQSPRNGGWRCALPRWRKLRHGEPCRDSTSAMSTLPPRQSQWGR